MVLTTLLLNDVRDDIKDRMDVTFTHGAIGTDNTTPTPSDTTLGVEVFRDTIDEFDKSATDTIVAQLRVLTTEANGNALKETGWLDAVAGGNLWTRNTFNTINKTSDIQVFLDTQVTLSVTEDIS